MFNLILSTYRSKYEMNINDSMKLPIEEDLYGLEDSVLSMSIDEIDVELRETKNTVFEESAHLENISTLGNQFGKVERNNTCIRKTLSDPIDAEFNIINRVKTVVKACVKFKAVAVLTIGVAIGGVIFNTEIYDKYIDEHESGRKDLARAISIEELAFITEIHGDDVISDLFTKAANKNRFAAVYETQKIYGKAEELYLEVLNIISDQVGDNHPSIASCMDDLGSIYVKMGRFEEAEEMYLDAISILVESLGYRHPSTSTSINNLAVLYERQGRVEAAKKLYEQTDIIIHDELDT